MRCAGQWETGSDSRDLEVLAPFSPQPSRPWVSATTHGPRAAPRLTGPALDASGLRWLAALTDKELVYVTPGTIFNQESGDLFERIVEGVRDLPVDVVRQ